MKLKLKLTVESLVGGAFLLLASQLLAQTSGTAHPEAIEESITTAQTTAVVAQSTVVVAAEPAPKPSAMIAQVETPRLQQEVQPVLHPAAPDPADAGIVTSMPYSETELAEGTMFKARLNEDLSTVTTRAGTRFTAQLSEDVLHGGKVIFPNGALLSGRITSVRGGHRIHGAASIHLEPELVTLPDGTRYRVSAQVVDLDQFHSAKVNSEGTIVRSDHFKRTLAEVGLVTGASAVTGAVIAGPAGAAIGAGVGAGVSTVWWLKQDRQQALPEGTQVVFSLTRPMELTPLAR